MRWRSVGNSPGAKLWATVAEVATGEMTAITRIDLTFDRQVIRALELRWNTRRPGVGCPIVVKNHLCP